MQKVTLAKLRVGRSNSHKIVAGHFDFFVFLFAGDVVAANFVSQFRRLLLEENSFEPNLHFRVAWEFSSV